MRIEAKAALLPLLLGWLLPAAAAQRIITDRPSPNSVSPKTHSQPAANPVSPKAQPRSASSPARKTLARRPDPMAPRLLDEDEGLHVIAAALGSHIRHASGDDCSQLVHDIYDRAGYSYPYANSWDLYAGDSHFRRVWKLQPGDLVVWQGHVGIVVSPKEHLFFSKLTSTGQDISSYDTPYWRGRGPARFFRYVKPGEAVLRAGASRPQPRPATRELAKAAPAPRAQRKSLTRVVVEADPPARPEPAGFDGVASEDPAPPAAPAEAPVREASAARVKGSTPQAEQVRQAILKNLAQAAPALSGDHASALSQPLIVFDDLRVESVRLDGDQGWAEVRIHQVGAFKAGHAELNKRTRRAFWSLRRGDDGWEVLTPDEATYLPRKAAVSVVAHQLSMLSDDPEEGAADPAQKKSLAQLLTVLRGR